MPNTAKMVIVETPDRLRKTAANNDMPESTYESSLAQLARNILQDKAPRLFEYEIGFQLLEKSDEGDRAVGVFGFAIGPERLYAPVIFLNGAVKGTELLWVKSSDQFVPLSEGWVNAFMRKKPSVLGKAMDRNEARKGVGYPDLMPLIRSPYKMASARMDYLDSFDLFKLAAAVPWVHKTLTRWLEEYPSFKQAMGSFYNTAQMPTAPIQPSAPSPVLGGAPPMVRPAPLPMPNGHALAATMAPNMSKPSTSNVLKTQQKEDNLASSLAKTGSAFQVEVTTRTTVVGQVLKTDLEDVQKVIANDYKVKDNRKDTSMVVPTSSTVSMVNPQKSGLYQVLQPDGSFEEQLIVFTSDTEPRTRCVVMDVSKGGKVSGYCCINPMEVWVQPQNTTGTLEETVNNIADAISSFPKVKKVEADWSGKYLIVGPDGSGYGPFRVSKDLTTKGSPTAMEVDLDYYGPMESPATEDNDMLFYRDGANKYWGYGVNYRRNPDRRGGGCGYHTMILTNKPGRTVLRERDKFFIPNTYKMLVLEEKSNDGDDMKPAKKNTLLFGRPEDLLAAIKTKTAALEVNYVFGKYKINNGPDLSLGDAVKDLVYGWDLREKEAVALIKGAEKAPMRVRVLPSEEVYNYAVKLAEEPGRFQSSGIPNEASAPEFPEVPNFQTQTLNGSVDSNAPYESFLPVDPAMLDGAGKTNNDIYAPPEGSLITQAIQAAQGGQKEVFDVGTFGSLVKQQSDEHMIDDQLPDLMKALDAYGTILFNLYYNREAFEDRYGKGDLQELEGTLRSAFKTTGEVVLFTKQKSVRAFPGDYGIDFSQNTP